LRKVVRNNSFTPAKYQDIVNQLFVTCYLGTKNSSETTNLRAKKLAEGINSHHLNVTIDEAYNAIANIFKNSTGMDPKFKVHGGSDSSDLALQNIQARIRMVVSFLFA
jgi:NAD+ synthase (glutamine-hydrolysing)